MCLYSRKVCGCEVDGFTRCCSILIERLQIARRSGYYSMLLLGEEWWRECAGVGREVVCGWSLKRIKQREERGETSSMS